MELYHCCAITFVNLFYITRTHAINLNSDTDDSRCHYRSCGNVKEGMLNVHLVPHSHDDLGWVKTVDEYFNGWDKETSNGHVKRALDAVLNQLNNDPELRFTYAETAYFSIWWETLDENQRGTVKELINNGQLEIVQGGWVSNDEATVHYSSIIEQMTLGHRWLLQTFGQCGQPKVAWQVDPFGHSREQAALFAQMGFDGVFLGRIHYNDMKQRKENKQMEFLWKGSDSLPQSKSEIFVSLLWDGYCAPKGFCFDLTECEVGEDINDDPNNSSSNNVERKIDEFLDLVKERAEAYQTNNIVIPFGCDFSYRHAKWWYKNLKLLIQYANDRQTTEGSNVNLLFSSPTCYLKAVNDARTSLQLSVKTDDFFPYASGPAAYWTGFYTSRPTLKGIIRSAENKLQICKQVSVLHAMGSSANLRLDTLKDAVAIAQHHDAVTGTAKQHVVSDYVQRLTVGLTECESVLSDAVVGSSQLSFCPLQNISICELTSSNDEFDVVAFNCLSKSRDSYIRIPVRKPESKYSVVTSEGLPVPVQTMRTFKTGQIPIEDKHGLPYQIVFKASLPALGHQVFRIRQQKFGNAPALDDSEPLVTADVSSREDSDQPLPEEMDQEKEQESEWHRIRAKRWRRHRSVEHGSTTTMKNELVELSFDSETGMLTKMQNLVDGVTATLQQNFFAYQSKQKSNERKSGAYLFRPIEQEPSPLFNSGHLEIVHGPLVQEARQKFSPWVSQIVRLFNGKPYAEVEITIGPIPSDTGSDDGPQGLEVVTRYETDIASDGMFFTDSNGRQVLQRVRNSQSTYSYDDGGETASANYYPVPTRIAVKDTQKQLTVITDRAEGGTSPIDGTVELMIHRRLFKDDAQGMKEALNELEDGQGLVVQVKHWLLLTPTENVLSLHRQYAMEMFYEPVVMFGNSVGGVLQFTGLANELPPNINILTLEPIPNENDSILLRLEHLFEQSQNAEQNTASVNLEDLFTSFKIVAVKELMLSGASVMDHWNPLTWNSIRKRRRRFSSSSETFSDQESLVIALLPMEIKTFQCRIQRTL